MSDQMQSFLIQSGNQIKESIGKLADALGVAAQQIFAIMIRQQIIIGITDILAWIFMFLIFLWALPKLRKNHALYYQAEYETDKEKYEPTFWVYGIITFISGFLTFICFFLVLIPGIEHLANPGYYAVKDIIEFIRGSVPASR